MPNHYETLGLPMNADEAEIAASLAREFGRVSNLQRIPARQAEAESRWHALQKIQQTLLNPTARSRYDDYLSALSNDNRHPIGFSAPVRSQEAVPSQTHASAPASGTSASIFCSTCGRPSAISARFCAECGAPIPSIDPPTPVPAPPFVAKSAPCPRCGRQVSSDQIFCGTCGASVNSYASASATAPSLAPASRPSSSAPAADWSGFSPYYQMEFRKIRESGESYKGRWNWAAFFFGGLWALTKGLWLSFLICLIGSIFTSGVVGIVYCFIYGARGNYMYYCAKIKSKQLPV